MCLFNAAKVYFCSGVIRLQDCFISLYIIYKGNFAIISLLYAQIVLVLCHCLLERKHYCHLTVIYKGNIAITSLVTKKTLVLFHFYLQKDVTFISLLLIKQTSL